jgi:hypothetical protein
MNKYLVHSSFVVFCPSLVLLYRCQAKDDADTLIALDLVTSMNTPVVVIAQDTNILVLLCYHWLSNCSNLYLQSDAGGLYE